jgi:hypothetical protein
MEIKITKLDEEKVYNEATYSTLEYFCYVKTAILVGHRKVRIYREDWSGRREEF